MSIFGMPDVPASASEFDISRGAQSIMEATKPTFATPTGTGQPRTAQIDQGIALRRFEQQAGRDCDLACLLNFEVSPDPDVAERQREVLNRLEQFEDDIVANLRAGRGLVLVGEPARGKRFLCASILRSVLFSTPWSVEMVAEGEFLKALDLADRTGPQSWLSCKLLCLHGLGESGALDLPAQNSLHALVSNRLRFRRSTILAVAAVSIEEARAKIGQSFDIVAERASVLLCDWPARQTSAGNETWE